MSAHTKHDDLPPEAFGVELDPLPPWARDDAATQADRVIHEFETEDRVTDSQRARDTAYVVGLLAPLPPDAEALVEACEARAALVDVERGKRAASRSDSRLAYDLSLESSAADIPALCALVRAQQEEIDRLTAVVESERRMVSRATRFHSDACAEIVALKGSHAIERAGLEGDKAQLAVDLDAARERAHGLANKTAIAIQQRANVEAERDRMKPVVEAAERWRDGADRGELARAIDAHRGHGPLDRSDLRGLAEWEAQ